MESLAIWTDNRKNQDALTMEVALQTRCTFSVCSFNFQSFSWFQLHVFLLFPSSWVFWRCWQAQLASQIRPMTPRTAHQTWDFLKGSVSLHELCDFGTGWPESSCERHCGGTDGRVNRVNPRCEKMPTSRLPLGARFFRGDKAPAKGGPSLRCLKLSASMGADDYQCG